MNIIDLFAGCGGLMEGFMQEGHFVGFFRNGKTCGSGNLGHIYETDVLDIFSRSEAWSKGVLDQIHKTSVEISLNQGVNEIELYAMDAGFVLEELFIYRKDVKVPKSYLGPCESWYTRQ